YSSGMRARLAFSVASHIDPEILIIDEILSVGDAAFQRKCFAKIEAFKNAGKTILFVSHSDKQIVELCDQAIWLSHGKKVIEGSPKLVTGLYAKYSKKKIDGEKNILEYKKLNNRNIKNNKSTHKDNINTPEDFFNKQLIPKSTIQYEEKGAKISDVMITTLKGNKVNTLSHGEKYLLRCQTEINEDTSKIRMGFSFKTAEGVNFGGGQYPYWKTKNGMSLQKGTYLLEWQFKCNFIEGIYFINNGVFSLSESEYLHKIVDSVMFKVINHTSTQSGGRIDFNIKAKLEKLNSTG
ncbi:MAG: Wzt carbohydrate-binding domain-containing protein, partial [Desulfobacteraceae bacterium]|nr:Wzt carbohydrate-binding domain-containing protein [Desulfobacteraceae bacterium]